MTFTIYNSWQKFKNCTMEFKANIKKKTILYTFAKLSGLTNQDKFDINYTKPCHIKSYCCHNSKNEAVRVAFLPW